MTGHAALAGRIGPTTLAASFGFALIQLDVTIVNVALPEIANDLGSGVAGLQWVVDAYALSFAALLLSAGFMGDRLGARRVYLAGFAIFAIASLACGLSTNALALIVARAAQGLGAAAMLPSSLALLNHAAAGDAGRRATAIGWWTAAGSIAIAAGPIIGGFLLQLGWRSIFLVNLPICLAGAMLTLRLPETEPSCNEKTLDLPGQLLAILTLASITGAIIEVRPQDLSLPVMVLGAAGLLAAPAFILTEQRSRAPMLPLRLFREGPFRVAVLYGVALNLTLYGLMFILSLYLQRVLAYDAISTGLAYLPLTATLFFSNLASGHWVSRSGPRLPMMLGAGIDAVGFGLLLLTNGHSSYWTLLPGFVLIPAGMGLGVPAMTTTVMASVEKQQSGIASGVLNAARQAGGAIGVALFGALVGGDDTQVVVGLHIASMIAIGLLATAVLLAAMGLRPAQQVKARVLVEVH